MYVSVRYVDVKGAIVGFKLDAKGDVGRRIGVWSSEGVHPRDFYLLEGCASVVAIVNRDSNNLVLVRRDRMTGMLGERVAAVRVLTPTSVVQY